MRLEVQILGDESAPRLVVTPAPADTAAELLAGAIAEADAEHGRARRLGRHGPPAGPAARVPRHVARLRLTWVDERCVPFHDERSNRGTVYRQEVLDPDVG